MTALKLSLMTTLLITLYTSSTTAQSKISDLKTPAEVEAYLVKKVGKTTLRKWDKKPLKQEIRVEFLGSEIFVLKN